MSIAAPRTDFVQSLAKGLAVIECFGEHHSRLTLSQVAGRTELTRAGARRLLLTLSRLGYCASDGKHFWLAPRVMSLGFAYLHANGIWNLAQPFMAELVNNVHESCSAAVLDGKDIVYVARVPTPTRIMSISLGLGSRLPAHLTSLGRVLLADLSDRDLYSFVEALKPLPRHTGYTITDAPRLRAAIRRASEDGYAVLDQELEPGLRSVAVPIRGVDGHAVAALNLGTHAARVSMDQLEGTLLPALSETARRISAVIGAKP
jgi:IclR family transcriptional regulator, pca regulon regulatory protein